MEWWITDIFNTDQDYRITFMTYNLMLIEKQTPSHFELKIDHLPHGLLFFSN